MAGNPRFVPLAVSKEDITIHECYSYLSNGISWRSRRSNTTAHKRLTRGSTRHISPIQALTDLVNLILSGDLPTAVSEILFGARLLALGRKMEAYDQSLSVILLDDWRPNMQTGML